LDAQQDASEWSLLWRDDGSTEQATIFILLSSFRESFTLGLRAKDGQCHYVSIFNTSRDIPRRKQPGRCNLIMDTGLDNAEPGDGHGDVAINALCIQDEIDWRPEYLAQSAWLEHIPFAFWIVKTLQPRSVIELGTHSGVSYGAFCQTVERMELNARCYAVDTWRGDEHAGTYGEEVFSVINSLNEARWKPFSTLLRMTFTEARQYFAAGEVDLLHIDGCHTYEAAAADFYLWQETLSDRGVVLFHDTNVRERGFGIWRLWQELKAVYPHFEFVHGHGLGVLGLGGALPGPLRALFAAAESPTATAKIRSLFAARGEAVSLRWTAQETEAKLHEATAGPDTNLELLQHAEHEAKTLRAQTAEAHRLAQEKAELAVRLDAPVRSSSWRITRPLRPVAALARGNPAHVAQLGKVPGTRTGAFPFVWARAQLGRAQRMTNLVLHLSQRVGGTVPLMRGGMRILRQQGLSGIRSKLRQLESGSASTPLLQREGADAIAQDHFHSLVAARFPNLSALPVYAAPGKERRITVVTDSIARGSLYGGVGTALIFAALAAERIGCTLRLVTRTEAGGAAPIANLLNASGINWSGNIEIIHAPHYTDQNSRSISVSAGDFFLTTSWWTTWATQLSTVRSRIAYIVQEDERMFYPYGDDHLRCSEMLSSQDFFYVVNSNLLLQHFQNQNLMLKATAFEPSFPSSLYYAPAKSEQMLGAKLRFFFYARPHNARNLYFRGLETVASAIENGILDPKEWDFYFAGHGSGSLLLPNGVRPIIPGVMTWEKYAAFVRSMDLGLSLMYTPHPSYPPLDLAASGSVVVTNRFGIKQELDQYSNNILCCDSDLLSLTKTIRKAADLSKDHGLRYRNYAHSGLQRDWSISMASALDKFAAWMQA
jgi:hypothetical protein